MAALAKTFRARHFATANGWPKESAVCGKSRWGRANIRSTRLPAPLFWCRRRTLCCTGLPGRANRTGMTRVLRSIDLVTRDAYKPLLPLSVVVHIDYQRAPERDSALWRREEVDYADAGPDAVGVFPRRGAPQNNAGTAARARFDSRSKLATYCGRNFESSTLSAWTC